MPRGWVSYSDDGDAMWMSYALAGLAAFVGSLWGLDKMVKLAQRLIEAERDGNTGQNQKLH